MKKIQREINEYLKERNWHNGNPTDYAKSISIEANELLELFQWGHFTVEDIQKDKVKFADIQSELADVLIYCVDMLNTLGLDGETVIREKMKHNMKKYPVSKVKGHNKEYFKIKAEYRKNRKK